MAKVPLEKMPISKYSRLKDRLEAFAKKFFEENNGKLTLPFPTFRQISRRFKLNYSEIEQLCEDSEVLDLVVGVGIGSGHYQFTTAAEYMVEFVGE